MPEGHSTRSVSTFVASPRPKWPTRPCQPLDELLPEISRICQVGLGARLRLRTALTRTFAPIPERLEAVPTSLTLSQWFPLPLLWYNRFRSGATKPFDM